MRAPFLVVALLATLALAFPTQAATQCWTTSPAQSYTTPAAATQAAHTYYVAIDSAPNADVWIYEETNHLPGLQREDAGRDDVGACTDGTVADTWLY